MVQVEAEVLKLEELKASKMKELVQKKKTESEELCLLRVRQQPARNPIDAAKKYSRITRTRNKRESKHNI